MQVAQKLGSFFYTYTQCTKIEPCDQFVGKLGNNLQNSSDFSLRVREIEEKTTSFRFNYMLLCGGAHRTNFVSSRDIRRRLLVNLRSRWSMVDMINFIIAHFNSSVARLRISLSSGIRMFARESETRVVLLKSVIFCRARSRIPNHK